MIFSANTSAETIQVDADAPTCDATNKLSCVHNQSQAASGASSATEDSLSPCSLYLAPSLIPADQRHSVRWGVFTGVDIKSGDVLDAQGDLVLPIDDPYKTLPYRGQHRWLSWLNHVHGTTRFDIPPNRPLSEMNPAVDLKRSATGLNFVDETGSPLDALSPGIASLAVPHRGYVNIVQIRDETKREDRSSPSLGYSTLPQSRFIAIQDIPAGSELYVPPRGPDDHRATVQQHHMEPRVVAKVTTKWLERQGHCMEDVRDKRQSRTPRIGPSTIPKAGNGAFAQVEIKKGQLVAPPAPLAVLKREDLMIYESNPLEATHFSKVLNKKKIIGTELLINHCFGTSQTDSNSSLLFLPLLSGVNYINHQPGEEANVAIRWPENQLVHESFLKKHPLDLIDMSGVPVFEYYALRDIQPGEELFLDYGTEWQEAWDHHLAKHKNDGPAPADKLPILTIEEQREEPYPTHLQTICRHRLSHPEEEAHYTEEKRHHTDSIWCSRPCHVDTRREIPGEDGSPWTMYMVSYSHKDHASILQHLSSPCPIPNEVVNGQLMVDMIRESDISLSDPLRTKRRLLSSGGFRHEIVLPGDLLPPLWNQPAVYEVADPPPNMKAGQLVPISWKHSGKPITRNAFFVGLPPNFNEHMFNYSQRMGAIDIFREVLYHRLNEPGEHRYVQLTDGEWYVQRPKWNSNMHWVIPANEVSRQSYLQALGDGGFDDVLSGVGVGLGLSNLTCFHNTFLGISRADDSIIHADFYETQRKSFDFLVPLIMSERNKNPEFSIQSRDSNIVVGLKYRYGVATVMGDWTMHKSAAVDYGDSGDIRVVSSIYCSEITAENRASLLKMYNEEHPAPFHHQFDLPVKEWHWDSDGFRSLPKSRPIGSAIPFRKVEEKW